MKLKITARTEGDAVVFTLQGPLDTEAAPFLNDTVAQAVPSGEPTLVFDLAEVPWVTSAALGVFAKLMKAHPGRIVLAAMQEYVGDTIRMNRLDKLCTIRQGVEEPPST